MRIQRLNPTLETGKYCLRELNPKLTSLLNLPFWLVAFLSALGLYILSHFTPRSYFAFIIFIFCFSSGIILSGFAKACPLSFHCKPGITRCSRSPAGLIRSAQLMDRNPEGGYGWRPGKGCNWHRWPLGFNLKVDTVRLQDSLPALTAKGLSSRLAVGFSPGISLLEGGCLCLGLVVKAGS